MEKSKLHKLLLRQLNKICTNVEESLEHNKEFEKFLDSVSKTYEEYDEHSYTLERSLELSFEELEVLQKEQKSSYDAQLKAMVHAMPDMMFLNDEDSVFLEVFAKDDSELYVSKESILGKTYKDIFPPELATFFKENLKKSIESNHLNIIEYELMINSKMEFYEARLVATEYLVEGKKTVISIVRNISKEKKVQQQLEYLATHDNLTRLPNRFFFQKKLKKFMRKAEKENTQGALFFLDIDQFKTINDTLGHDIGDKILLKITKRLKRIVKEEDLLARFGGDEFVLIVNKASDLELQKMAHMILEQFLEPFKVEKYALDVTTSIGICIFPKKISSVSQLLKQADIAMYEAKSLGRNQYKFFTQALYEKIYEEFNLEVKLKKAIEKNQFYLLYQPQIRLSDNKLIAVEALIRWKSSEIISPDKFIPLAEQCGYIEHISDWVIEEVCKQINRWKEEGIEIHRVAINLSRQELGRRNLLSRITKIINKYDISFSSIEFEVTETALYENSLRAFENISALRLNGFLVSIDDFGTGYSSLSNINESLFDKLKIDRSFVSGIKKKKESESIIKATIAIAKSLNLKVLAEGVETLEQLEFLKQYNCDEVQGYYYSRPILPEDIVAFVNSQIETDNLYYYTI